MKILTSAISAGLILSLFVPSGFSQTTGSFVATGNMTTPRVSHTATLLQSGQVLITGGTNPSSTSISSTSSAELYDPSTGAFIPTGSMLVSRRLHLSTRMADGRVLVVGGCNCLEAEIYDPGLGTFSKTGSTVAAKWPSGAALLKDGRVLVASGTSIEIYDPRTGTFADAKQGVVYGSAVSLLDGRVFVGEASAGQIYDPATNDLVTVFPGKSVSKWVANPAVHLSNGQILFVGGSEDPYGEAAIMDASLYDPATGLLRFVGRLSRTRSHHTTTLLKDGRVLVTGGYNGNGSDWETGIFSSAEVYEPLTETFTGVGDMTRHRMAHTATRLQDGRVLIAGGLTHDPSAELFVPDDVIGLVPSLSMDAHEYCVGDSWHLKVTAAQPSSEVTLMGTWDQIPWAIANFGTVAADGAFAADGPFDAGSAGNHTLWVLAGGKVSNTVSIKISDCRVGLTVDSTFRIGAPWIVSVTSNLSDALVKLDGMSNGVAWQTSEWGRTRADGSFQAEGAFPEGTEGTHELRVRVGDTERSRVFRFNVLP